MASDTFHGVKLSDLPVDVRLIPAEAVAKINAKEELHWSMGGAKLFSIHHMRGSRAEAEQRYVVYMYHENWALLVYDFTTETWYVNDDSHAATAVTPQLVGNQAHVNKQAIAEIADHGVAATVQRKLLGAINGR